MSNQKKLFKEIQNAGYNICTCGKCGEIILHKINPNVKDLDCSGCNTKISIEHCPDLYN